MSIAVKQLVRWQIRLLKTTLFMAVVITAACATGPNIQTYWINPQFGPEVQQQQFTLDSTECTALANQLIPEPLAPPKSQSGTITLDTSRGPVHGTYQSRQSSDDGLLAGYKRVEREQARKNYAVACMAKRGWEQRVVGQ
jgi:hypothetical protein